MPFSSETILSGAHAESTTSHQARGNSSNAPNANAAPPAQMLFEPVRDRYGLRLALVFGNQAPGGICPYYAGELCHHCDIGAGEGRALDLTTNRLRLDWFRDYYRRQLESIRHFVVYNSGSVLNPREMLPELLEDILGFARSLPAVRVVSLDSREAYITPKSLRRILSVAGEEKTVRPILGLESSDDRIRNEILQKAMPRTAIMRVFRDLATIAAEFGANRIGLDINIVIGGPGTTALTAIDDALRTAEFALSAGRAAARIALAVKSAGANSVIFIGWQDEAHDLEPDQRSFDLKQARSAFDRFNQTNDPAVFLESWLT
jgi:uncharacterized Fe-S cluster-containing MiaB family protein